MKWIKHDSGAHRDAKLRRLVMAYGLEGYGLFWYCIENIASNVTMHKYTFELEHDAKIIAFDTGMSAEKVETIMKKMVDLGLFESSGGIITCLKLAKRLDQSMTSNPEMRKIISLFKKQGVIENSHDSIMTESRNSHARVDKIRLEESKDIPTTIPSNCPQKQILNLYHEKLIAMPKVRVWTDKRKALLRARWTEDESRQNLEYWARLFEHIAKSDFLNGGVPGRNGGKPFIADLEWLLNQNNFVKVIEGKYENAA